MVIVVVAGYLGNGQTNVIFTELRLCPMSEKLPPPISGENENVKKTKSVSKEEIKSSGRVVEFSM